MPKGNTDLYERPRALVVESLQPDRNLARPLTAQELSMVSSNAALSGLSSALGAGVVSGALVYAANTFSPRFRGALGISGKTALVVTPIFGAFTLSSHLRVADATRDASGYAEQASVAAANAKAEPLTSLPLWCRAANVVYEHPFKTIMGVCFPSYAALFHIESTNPATAKMPLSQRLIHTRVYGQALVITVTAAIMMFQKSMDAEGAYRMLHGQVVRQAHVPRSQKLRNWYSNVGQEGQEGGEGAERAPEKELNSDLIMPLIYVPLIPLVVIGLRGRVAPDRLQKISLGLIGTGLLHAGSVMFSDSSLVMD